MSEATAGAVYSAAPAQGGRRRLAIIASLVLVLIAAGSALVLVGGVDRQLSDVVHTYDVRKSARELMQSITDAESGQRGYVLTGDRNYLVPYNAALASIDERMALSLSLTDDNPEQNRRLQAVSDELSEKLAEMARTVDLVADGQQAEAEAEIRSDSGLNLMTSLRSQINTFIAEEDRLLAERGDSFEVTRQLLTTAILTAMAGAAVLAYALFMRTQQQVRTLALAQQQLLVQRDELEEHVRARTVELEEARAFAEQERGRVEALLQDTNHRIGNSLATVSSLLGLQVNRAKSDEVKTALEAARSRVHAIASGHRRLRLGTDLETTRADEFLEAVIDDLRETQAPADKVNIEHDFDPVTINARDATTIGIMVGELITNALKHAFPGDRRGTITARLFHDEAGVPVLSVADDGVGLPDQAVESDGLGKMIVKTLARQFGGSPDYSVREGGGTVISLKLPNLMPTPSEPVENNSGNA